MRSAAVHLSKGPSVYFTVCWTGCGPFSSNIIAGILLKGPSVSQCSCCLAGIEQNVGNTVHDCESPIEPIPPQLQPGWAEYPGNTGQRLSAAVMQKLNELYMLGNVHKKRKVSADRALQILLSNMISDDWMQQIDVTVPKIKAFFQMPPSKQLALIKKNSLEEDMISTKRWRKKSAPKYKTKMLKQHHQC